MMSYQDFGLHLKEIRKNQNITQLDISKKLGISRQAYSNYEQGLRFPDIKTLSTMSVLLNENLFLYFTEPVIGAGKPYQKDRRFIMDNKITNLNNKNFARIIRQKREALSLSQNDISEMLGISRSTYTRYELGIHMPTIENLFKLSNIYNMNPFELIYALIPSSQIKSDAKYKKYIDNTIHLSTSDYELLNNYQKLNPNQKAAINNLIDTFL